ncbi:hypothetical protein [Telluribacter humicola]|uniref:hypothetical protein n=1 Tax=Telluribacter humicola TaxID=1720261 RepID=UPI001A9721AA|nr:hypothetical protein [Telluribacter humicola]
MAILDKTVKVPKALHELHGVEASAFDLLITYSTVLLVTALVLIEAGSYQLTATRFILLGALTMDLAGGVVSNFTKATNDYYSASPSKRYVFILLHVIQPCLLWWVFPNEGVVIAAVAIYTIAAMTLINLVRTHEKQRVLAAFLLVGGLSMLFLLPGRSPMLTLLLALFEVKLILAFPVRWK